MVLPRINKIYFSNYKQLLIILFFTFSYGCGPGQDMLTSSSSLSSPSIVYQTPTISTVVGTAVSIPAPTTSGSIGTFSVNPSLPAGLTLNSTSGAISGTPSAKTATASYTVSGSSAASANLSITVQAWAQEAFLKAPNSQSADFFGRAVFISGDTLVVGADGEDSNQTTITNGTTASADNSASFSGAIYVYKRSGTTWVQEAYIKAPNAEASDFFGNIAAVAISGDTIVVGAYGEDSNQTTITNGTTASADNSFSDPGAVYVFKRTGTTWAPEAYLKPPNTGSLDKYGISVAIDGDTIVVGASEEDSNLTTITNGTTASANNTATDSGAIYIYKRTGVNWAQEAYIKAPNANNSDNFGMRVAISGDTVIAAATGEDSNQTTITNGSSASSDNSATDSGAVYVFKRSGTTWANEAYLKPSNAESNDSFGISISINSDTIVVGASGEASNQTTITNNAIASADNSATSAGAAYVFKRTGGTWTEEAYLKAPNAQASDIFGICVAVSGDRIVVGARDEDSNQTSITNGTTASADNSITNTGAAYVFKRTGTTWAHEAYLKAPVTSTANEFYGYSCSVSGSTVVIGAHNEDSNQTTVTNGTTASADNSAAEAGAAYVYKLD